MQTINVIGGSGFIGTRLVRRLRSKEQLSVQITDKAPSKAHPDLVTLGDVRSVEQLRESIANQSVIVNLAAEHRDDVRPLSLYDEVNVGGARNICAVASEKGVRTIIFTSTVDKVRSIIVNQAKNNYSTGFSSMFF
jgi:nucleoside-diphosphate-sugar epimerase